MSKSPRKKSKTLSCIEHNRLEIVSEEAAAIKKIFRPKITKNFASFNYLKI